MEKREKYTKRVRTESTIRKQSKGPEIEIGARLVQDIVKGTQQGIIDGQGRSYDEFPISFHSRDVGFSLSVCERERERKEREREIHINTEKERAIQKEEREEVDLNEGF